MKWYLFALVICVGNISWAQDKVKELDQLFEGISEDQPGVVVGVVMNGDIFYQKGFGCADLVNDIRITDQTPFQLGELSKQFTTLAILLLERQGTISLNDDIRTYIPELPKYNKTVRIAHLLNHTSGLHDVQRIQYLNAGSMNLETQDQVIQLIAAQQELAFTPGSKFSFHEAVTESILMAEIVSRASGKTFAEYVKENIFIPLGMDNAFVRTNHNAISPRVAQAYQYEEEIKAYLRNGVSNNTIGFINVYGSASDLGKWYAHYQNPKGDLGKLIQKLDTPVQTDDGTHFEYYWGKMAIGREFSHPERGLSVFWNYGFQGGYGTNVFRYNDQEITCFVLGNNDMYNGGLAQEMINIVMEDQYTMPALIDFSEQSFVQKTTEELRKYEGHYWFDEGYASEIFVKNDTLRTRWLFGKSYQTLVPISETTFQQYAKMEDVRLFNFIEERGQMTIDFRYNESTPDIMKRYTPHEPSIEELQSIAGSYYHPSYSTVFTFSIKEGNLVAKSIHHPDIIFKPITKDVYTSTSLFFNALTFKRDKSGKVESFSIRTDGIKDLVFMKAK